MDVKDYGKDQLADIAWDRFDTKLDKRKKVKELREEVQGLIDGAPVESDVPSTTDDFYTQPVKQPEKTLGDYIKNKKTGCVFTAHKTLHDKVKTVDYFVYCDKDGKEV